MLPCVHVHQSLKDAIVVTAGGAEVLPFLAFFCVLPASLAFFVLYGKLVCVCVWGGLPAEECVCPLPGKLHGAFCQLCRRQKAAYRLPDNGQVFHMLHMHRGLAVDAAA